MKICPFISHMIGDEKTNILEVEQAPADEESKEAAQAIILGYDGEGGVAVKPKTRSKTKSKVKKTKADSKNESSHLFCMKDTCRFYRKKSAECMFDNMFEMMDTQTKAAKKPQRKPAEDKTAVTVTKELDKFWKFQTASVAELISSIGEAEKKQGDSLDGFRKEIHQKLDNATSKDDAPWAKEIRKDMSKLRNALEAREESAENFSTTVSDVVVNVEDGMKSMREKTDNILERIDKLEQTVDNFGVIEKHIESAVRNLEKVEGCVEKAVSRSVGEIVVPDVSNGVRSVSDQVAEFVSSTRQFESRFEDWQKKMESRVDEIHSGQKSWGVQLGDIAQRQDEVIATLEGGQKKQREKGAASSQNREARKLNNLGVKSFHNDELELARDQFLRAVALDDQFAESYNNLGLVFTELGEQDRATEAYEKAIALNPDLHATYNNLGYVFYLQGNYERAAEMYEEALRRSPENSSASTNLGNACYKMGKNEEARDAWKRALELDPGNEKASRNLERLESE